MVSDYFKTDGFIPFWILDLCPIFGEIMAMNDNLDFVIALPKEKFINQEQYEKLGTVA